MKYAPEDGFPYYLNLVENKDCATLFSSISTFTFLDSLDENKAAYRYAPEKWSIKQIVGHLTDHERIKIFRALMLSRNKRVELWGYDQDSLVENSRFDEMSLRELTFDFSCVRQASLSFVSCLSTSQLNILGMAKQYKISLEDFLRSIIGHEIHHLNIIKERYLKDFD